MPKKNIKNLSFLIQKNKFYEAKNTDNLRVFEDCLTELINTANMLYNEALAANNPKKFINCIKNYGHIKVVIDDKKTIFQSNRIELYDLETCLAICQARLNSINTKPINETQLNTIKKNIKTIKVNFDAVNNRINKLESELKNTASTTILKELLDYRNDFLDHWKKDSNERKAHSYYNLAETFKKKSDSLKNKPSEKCQLLTNAKNLLVSSLNFYNKAQLFNYAEQTKKRIDELDFILNTALLSKNMNTLVETDPAIFTASHTIKSDWKVTNKATLVPSLTKKHVKNSPSTKDPILSTHRKRKRESFDEHASFNPTKKSKPFPELKSLWQAESEKIIKQFRQIKIDDNIAGIVISLTQKLPLRKSLDECKAIVHNNRAMTMVAQDLQNPLLLHAEKLVLLKKVKNLFKESAHFYNQANLRVKRDEIKQYIHCIASSLKNLASFVDKIPTGPTSSIEQEGYLVKSISIAENIASKNRVAYRTPQSDNHFFKSSLKKNAPKGENQPHTRQSYLLYRA